MMVDYCTSLGWECCGKHSKIRIWRIVCLVQIGFVKPALRHVTIAGIIPDFVSAG